MATVRTGSIAKWAVLLHAVFAATFSVAASDYEAAFRAVVKVHVTFQRPDCVLPWQAGRHAAATGTGFIIAGKRILTNAHVVSDAKFLQVQKHGEARMYDAAVEFIAHDCDLATLTVDDPSFAEGTENLVFADSLPALNDTVTVIGYPTGGARLSITRGVVSRLDYSIYTHSGVDYHLVIQVDAAINPGNSGGPVMLGDKVVGLAFQGLSSAENIGYGIPVPVLRHFLGDIADGAYHGYPELGVSFMDARNPALRNKLLMTDQMTGVVIQYVDPFGSALAHLRSGDVLLSIDAHGIADDGTINVDGNTLLFAELLERKQCGETIELQVLRGGKTVDVSVPLATPADPFIYRNTYDTRPEYVVVGGLVFSPLSREYLRSLRHAPIGTAEQRLLYYSAYAKLDSLHEGKSEFVVLAKRLPNSVNAYADGYINGIVKTVNSTRISRMKDLVAAFAEPTNGFHVVEFEDSPDRLVIDADALSEADRAIRREYGIVEPAYVRGDR